MNSMIQYIRHFKILIAFLAIANIHNIILANDEIKRERPGKLFSPAKIPLLEDPGRDKWQKPEEILNLLDIKKGQTVADIGAGSGYLTVKLSERVGAMGTVYAVDVQQEMLEYIKKRTDENGIKNVILILNNMDEPKLPASSLDIAILLSTYHEIVNPIDFIKKIKQALKPHGKLAILEFTDESPIGPPIKIRLPEDIIIEELKQAGFTLTQRHLSLLPYQYFLVFTSSHQ